LTIHRFVSVVNFHSDAGTLINSSPSRSRYGICPACTAACAQALSYWATALGLAPFVSVGLPMFPAYFFALALLKLENGEPSPVFDLAPFPKDGKPVVGPQLDKTFEPVCPGAAVAAPGFGFELDDNAAAAGWRSKAKVEAGASVSMVAMAMENLKFLMSCLLDAQYFRT
jgi:hypothetical protein